MATSARPLARAKPLLGVVSPVLTAARSRVRPARPGHRAAVRGSAQIAHRFNPEATAPNQGAIQGLRRDVKVVSHRSAKVVSHRSAKMVSHLAAPMWCRHPQAQQHCRPWLRCKQRWAAIRGPTVQTTGLVKIVPVMTDAATAGAVMTDAVAARVVTAAQSKLVLHRARMRGQMHNLRVRGALEVTGLISANDAISASAESTRVSAVSHRVDWHPMQPRACVLMSLSPKFRADSA